MEITLTELCQDLRNWFDRERLVGEITISNGEITVNGKTVALQSDMYFRVIGSYFSEGIHKYPDADMPDEIFSGAVWRLAIPAPVINLATEIAAWREKYETVNSFAMSPFTSESVGSHSVSKSATSDGSSPSWQSAFAARMNAWRKIL